MSERKEGTAATQPCCPAAAYALVVRALIAVEVVLLYMNRHWSRHNNSLLFMHEISYGSNKQDFPRSHLFVIHSEFSKGGGFSTPS